MAIDLLRAFQALSTEKEAVRKREEKLVSDLRDTLGRLGYRLEPVHTNGTVRRTSTASSRRAAAPGPKALACPECTRTFALPLHLGRHMSVVHKGKRRAAQPTTQADPNGSRKAGPAKEAPRRSRMSLAARRAAARRMKAYWRKRKATKRTMSSR